MRIWGKIAVAAVLPLMLTGCLWGPGKFTSNLALNKSGAFVLDYRGEIVLQLPDKDSPPAPWNAEMARCTKLGEPELVDPVTSAVLDDAQNEDEDEADDKRPCTAAEIAKLKTQYEIESAEKTAKKAQENEQMAKMFGLPGTDDASNRRFAANLVKYAGWRSVS